MTQQHEITSLYLNNAEQKQLLSNQKQFTVNYSPAIAKSQKNYSETKMSSPVEDSILQQEAEKLLVDPRILENALQSTPRRFLGGVVNKEMGEAVRSKAEKFLNSKVFAHAKKCHRRKISQQYLPRFVSMNFQPERGAEARARTQYFL